MPKQKTTVRKIEPGMNLHIDRIRAIWPDDGEVFRIGDKIVIKPKGTTLEDLENE